MFLGNFQFQENMFALSKNNKKLTDKLIWIAGTARSGTSIGANIWEAQSSESRKDFGHKLKIADKEAKEVEYWLLLCKSSEHIKNYDEELDGKLLSIQKLLSRIISTNKSRG